MYDYKKLKPTTIDLSHAEDSKDNIFYVMLDDSDAHYVRQWHVKTKPTISPYPVFKVIFADMFCGTQDEWEQSKHNRIMYELMDMGLYREDEDGAHIEHQKIKLLQSQQNKD